MGSEMIADADHGDCACGRGHGARFPGHPDRSRVDRPRRTHPRRVLRDIQRLTSLPVSASGAASDRHPAVGPRRLAPIVEGHHQERHRVDAQRRRDGRAPSTSRPSPGTSHDLVAHVVHSGSRTPGRDAGRTCATRPPTSGFKKEEPDGGVGTGEASSWLEFLHRTDRPPHRQGRPARRVEGYRRSSGLVARSAHLARPTDAAVRAHRRVRRHRGRFRPGRPSRRSSAPPAGRAATARRHHHGRQPPLGAPRDLPELDGHAAGVEAIRAPCPPRCPPRRPGDDAATPSAARTGPARTTRSSACSVC